jgi:hypothetical protein
MKCEPCPVNALPVTHGNQQTTCQCATGYVALSTAYVATFDFDESQPSRQMDIRLFMDLASNPDVRAKSSSQAFVCGVCPVGGNCLEAGQNITNLQPQKSYSAGVLDKEHIKFYECGEACTGASDADSTGCLKGNTGALCGACVTGYAKGDDNVCHQCTESAFLSALKMIGLIIIFTICLTGFSLWTLSRSWEPLSFASVTMKIFLNSFQLNSVALVLPFVWPSPLDTLLVVQDQVSQTEFLSLALSLLSL